MLNFGNKEFRNLQEQVLKNMEDIKDLKFGLNIRGTVKNVPDLPRIAELGDAYLVGPSAPFYIYVRTADKEWTNMGTLASEIPGPKGSTGEQGIQGERGSQITTGYDEPTNTAKANDMYVRYNGELYTNINGKWELFTNLKGPQGLIGPKGSQGPKGDTGLTGPKGEKGDPTAAVRIFGKIAHITDLPSPTAVPRDAGYIVTGEGNTLFAIVGDINLTWASLGTFVYPDFGEVAGTAFEGDRGKVLENKVQQLEFNTNISEYNSELFETAILSQKTVGYIYDGKVGGKLSYRPSTPCSIIPVFTAPQDFIVGASINSLGVSVHYLDDENKITNFVYYKDKILIHRGEKVALCLRRGSGTVSAEEIDDNFILYFVPSSSAVIYEPELVKGTIPSANGMPIYAGDTSETANRAIVQFYANINDIDCINNTANNMVFGIFTYDKDNKYIGFTQWLPTNCIMAAKTIKARFPATEYIRILYKYTDDRVMTVEGLETLSKSINIYMKNKAYEALRTQEAKVRLLKARFDNQFQIIAYSQSASNPYPINTKEEYEYAAVNQNFTGIKGDVETTSDGKLVMCHDEGFTLDENGRITTYDPSASTTFKIHDRTLDEILALEYKYPVNDVYIHPATLDDLLQVCKKYKKLPYITVRTHYSDIFAPAVAERVKYYSMELDCIINSFDDGSLAKIRKYLPDTMVSMVVGSNPRLTTEWIDRIQVLGNAIWTWFGTTNKLDTPEFKHVQEYAVAHDTRIYGAVANSPEDNLKSLEAGLAGTQSYYSQI